MSLNIKQTLDILDNIGHIPKKKLGQNFLIDRNIVNKSVDLAEIKKNEIILEVGPGLGTLSEALLSKNCILFAIEKDPNLSQFLKDKIGSKYINFNLTQADCTRYPIGGIKFNKNINSFKVVSNLPYSISSPWLDKLFEKSAILPSRMVLMLQKEAADRYYASSSTKNFGAISIFIQSAYNIHSVHSVSSTCFFPKPNVESALIRLDLKKEPIYYNKESKNFIRSVFTQRRKQIHSLCKKTDFHFSKKWLDYLSQNNYSGNVRAEDINLKYWQFLGYKDNNKNKQDS